MNDSSDSDAPLSSPVAAPPQFSTAEYTHIPGTERCRICNNLIGSDYFRVNDQMACAQCASDAQNGQPRDSHVAFTRGLLLGIAAAIAGMAAYATFTIITGWYIGYLALGVGYLVAKAIKKGSHGLGGRRYQITAVLLTYAAISLAAIPIGISAAMKHRANAHPVITSSTDSASTNRNADQPQPVKKHSDYGAIAGQLLLWGLASPFMELSDPVHGLIGLFILFIGLRIAWQQTATQPLAVDGPYAVTGRA